MIVCGKSKASGVMADVTSSRKKSLVKASSSMAAEAVMAMQNFGGLEDGVSDSRLKRMSTSVDAAARVAGVTLPTMRSRDSAQSTERQKARPRLRKSHSTEMRWLTGSLGTVDLKGVEGGQQRNINTPRNLISFTVVPAQK